MTTPLTIYPSNQPATTLPQASLCSSALGGAGVGIDNLVGTALGYGEFLPLGNVAAWAALAGLPAQPSKRGALLDTALLDGQQIVAGNWIPTVRGSFHNATAAATADILHRAWVYHPATGTFTLIGLMSLLAQTIGTGSATYVFSSTALSAALLNVGERLYYEWFFNITANPNTNAAATFRFNVSNSTLVGPNVDQLVTPGYMPAPISMVVGAARRGGRNDRRRSA